MLRDLGVHDPIRSRLVLAGITREEIATTWRAVRSDGSKGAKRVRSPLRVFLRRVCDRYGVALESPNAIKVDPETAALADRVDEIRAEKRGSRTQ